MNTPTIQMPTPKKELPKLVKGPSSYKLIVPEKAESKIRYLIRKFPHTEWSGVLFYSRTGSFETEDLVLTCEDIYPMDLGTTGWTEFNMSEDVATYIAENLELFNCEMGLIHSHHTLGAFFSDQDELMLRQEGEDTNCFLSLVVDTAGTYKARITRKVTSKYDVDIKCKEKSYQFFGDGEIPVSDLENKDSITEKTVTTIEYFDLEVERHQVTNDFDYLDTRFDEIAAKKQKNSLHTLSTTITSYTPLDKYVNDNAKKHVEEYLKGEGWWYNDSKKNPEPQKVKQPTLFEDENIPLDDSLWYPDPDIIKNMVTKMVCCCLNKINVDLERWIKVHMEKHYEEIFTDEFAFQEWADFIVDFLINHYPEDEIPEEAFDPDSDDLAGIIAQAMIGELSSYPSNDYIETYNEVLSRYI